jgi:hypothetical protein
LNNEASQSGESCFDNGVPDSVKAGSHSTNVIYMIKEHGFHASAQNERMTELASIF